MRAFLLALLCSGCTLAHVPAPDAGAPVEPPALLPDCPPFVHVEPFDAGALRAGACPSGAPLTDPATWGP